MTAPLVDPVLADWQSRDPAAFLEGPAAPMAPSTPLHSRSDVERELAIALVVIVGLIVRELHKRAPVSPEDAEEAMSGAWQKNLPIWVRLAAPAVRQAYVLGRMDASTETMVALAEQHAEDLGNYFAGSSSEAVLEGLNRQLNQGWSFNLAWRRASAAYGLDKKQMRGYLVSAAKQGETSPDLIPAVARASIDRLLLTRATRIGHDQAYTSEQTGRALLWMRAYAEGQIPGAKRRWNLGASEQHCAICRSVARQKVDPDQPFVIPGGTEIWAPRAHPGCTCFIDLVAGDQVIAKAGVIAAGIALRAADTGRVLMLQRALDEKDPQGGKWEFPGGHLEADETPLEGAKREWEEEVRRRFPLNARYAGEWHAGRYEGFVFDVPDETVCPSHTRGRIENPDDPDGDCIEAIAWWTPEHLQRNLAVRDELRESLHEVGEALEVKLSKAMGRDPYNRDQGGRFAATEQRTRTAVMDRPPSDQTLLGLIQTIRPAPAALTEDRPRGLTRSSGGPLTGARALTGQRSLTSTPTLAGLTEQVRQEQAQSQLKQQRAGAPPIIRITLPPLPPPPAAGGDPARGGYFVWGWDLEDYYAEMWGGSVGFGHIIPFDEIRDFYREKIESGEQAGGDRIEASHSHSLWSGLPAQEAWYSDADWDDMMNAALPVWKAARNNAEEVLDELSDGDLREISRRAFHGEQHPSQVIRDLITDSLDGDEEVGPGIGDAYADFVTFARPDYLQDYVPESLDWDRMLASLPDRDIMESESPWAVRVTSLARKDKVEDLRSTYLITTGEYVSAMGERARGRPAPTGQLNVRVITVEPDEVGMGPQY